MSDWTVPPIPADQQPPGPISPPPPDQIQPTDPGWSAFVRKEADKTGLKVTPDCSVSIEVVATGYSVVRPVDGDNPTDYAADKDWGWKADRVYETQPPEPYQDFTVLTRRADDQVAISVAMSLRPGARPTCAGAPAAA
jgi:hypothetical protein